MKCLVSITPDYVTEVDRDKYAPDGEPVIPWYPAPSQNVFLSVTSFKKSILAEVRDIPALPVDAILEKLVKQYPGLPRSLHANYIFHSVRAANRYKSGTKFRIFITPESAKLQEIGGKQDLFTLWTEQPVGDK